MKKLLIFLFSACLLFSVFGKGGGEDEQLSINFGKQGPPIIYKEFALQDPPMKFVWEGDIFDRLAEEFEKETGIKVIGKHLPEGSETAKDINSSLSSPDPYDIIWIYGGGISIYNSNRFAVNLKDYLPKSYFNQFLDSAIGQFNFDPAKVIYIIPNTAWSVMGNINTTILGDADIDIPDVGWTIAEFESMARSVKEIGIYPTYIYCKGDYGMLGWFASFGAKLLDEKGKLILNIPEGIAALEYMKRIIDEGWSPPGPAALSWGHQIQMRGEGKAIFTSCVPGGPIEESKPITYPRAKGIEKVPVMCGPDATMVFNNKSIYGEKIGEAKIKAAIEFLQLLTGDCDAHYVESRRERISPLKNFVSDYGSPGSTLATSIISEHGIYNQAMGNPYYSLIRNNLGLAMGLCFSGEKSAKDALDWFVNETNREIGY